MKHLVLFSFLSLPLSSWAIGNHHYPVEQNAINSAPTSTHSHPLATHHRHSHGQQAITVPAGAPRHHRYCPRLPAFVKKNNIHGHSNRAGLNTHGHD